MSHPRVALVGARRVRQGLGPFVARDLAAAGVAVEAVLGTREASARQAADALAPQLGHRPRPYTELARLRAEERLDGLVVLSPAATHETFLRAALDAGLHVLCEKPLLWGGPGLAARAREIAEASRARGLLLAENCQWPFTLEAFRALHPDLPEGPPESFAMHLAPASSGEERLGDSLSHPLSLLQAVAPDPGTARLENVRVEGLTDATQAFPAGTLEETLRLHFDYVTGAHRVVCEVRLVPAAGPPRPAGYALGPYRAERRIHQPGYRMELAAEGRGVPLPDPLTARIAAFAETLRAVRAGEPAPDPAPLVRRMEMLETALAAYRQQAGGRPTRADGPSGTDPGSLAES